MRSVEESSKVEDKSQIHLEEEMEDDDDAPQRQILVHQQFAAQQDPQPLAALQTPQQIQLRAIEAHVWHNYNTRVRKWRSGGVDQHRRICQDLLKGATNLDAALLPAILGDNDQVLFAKYLTWHTLLSLCEADAFGANIIAQYFIRELRNIGGYGVVYQLARRITESDVIEDWKLSSQDPLDLPDWGVDKYQIFSDQLKDRKEDFHMEDANQCCEIRFTPNGQNPMPKLQKVFNEPRNPLGSILLLLYNFWFLVHIAAAVITLSMASEHGWHWAMIVLGASDMMSFVLFSLSRVCFYRPVTRNLNWKNVVHVLGSLFFGTGMLVYNHLFWPPMENMNGEYNMKKLGGWLLISASLVWFLAPLKMGRLHAGKRWKYLITLLIFSCSIGVMYAVNAWLTLPTLRSSSPSALCEYYQLDSVQYLDHPTSQYIQCWIGTVGLWLPLMSFNLYSSYFGFVLPMVIVGVIIARLKGTGELANAEIIQYSLEKIAKLVFYQRGMIKKEQREKIISFAIAKSLRANDLINDEQKQKIEVKLGDAENLDLSFDVVQDIKFWAGSLKFMKREHQNKWIDQIVFASLPALSQIVPIFEEQILYSNSYLRERNGKRTNLQFLINQYHTEFRNFHERMQRTYGELVPTKMNDFIKHYHRGQLSPILETEVRIWSSMCGQTVYRTMRGCLSYRLVVEMYHAYDVIETRPEMVSQTIACMQKFTDIAWLKQFYTDTYIMMYRLNSPNFYLDEEYLIRQEEQPNSSDEERQNVFEPVPEDDNSNKDCQRNDSTNPIYDRLEVASVFGYRATQILKEKRLTGEIHDVETLDALDLLEDLENQIVQKLSLFIGNEDVEYPVKQRGVTELMEQFPFVSFTLGLRGRQRYQVANNTPFYLSFGEEINQEPFHVLTIFNNGTIQVINMTTQRELFFKVRSYELNNGGMYTPSATLLGQRLETPLTIESRNSGLEVSPCDINFSHFEFEVKSVYPRKRELRWSLKSLAPLAEKGDSDGEAWQGKAVNQRNGKTMAWGDVYQTKDANQGGSVMEALKIPFILRKFIRGQANTIPAIMGFREKIITERHGSVARYQAYAEWTFGTVVQRVLGLFGIRLHYGHPDFIDAEFVNGPGKISHTTPTWNISEDVTAGYETLMQNRQSIHTDRIQDEKGRDVSLGSTAGFTSKISRGAANLLKTQEIAYLYEELDVPRKFTLFQSSLGTYIGTALMMHSVRLYVLVIILFTLAGFSASMMGAYSLVYATPWVFQIGSFTAIPLLLETAVEKSAWSMFRVIINLPLATLFFIFQSQTMAYHFLSAFITGKAAYVSTGRMLGLERERFSTILQTYGDSHIKPVINLVYGIVAYYLVAETRPSGTIPMFAVIIVIFVVILVPTLFNAPAASFKVIFLDFKHCLQFIFTTLSITEYSSRDKIALKPEKTSSLQELNMCNFLNDARDSFSLVEFCYGIYYLIMSLFWIGIAMTIPGTMKDFTTLIVLFVLMYLLTRMSTIFADREHHRGLSSFVIYLQYMVLVIIVGLCIYTGLIGFYFHFALIGFFISYKLARSIFACLIYFRLVTHKQSKLDISRISKRVVRLAYLFDLVERPFYVAPLLLFFLLPSLLLSTLLWIISPIHDYLLYTSSFKKSINLWSKMEEVKVD